MPSTSAASNQLADYSAISPLCPDSYLPRSIFICLPKANGGPRLKTLIALEAAMAEATGIQSAADNDQSDVEALCVRTLFERIYFVNALAPLGTLFLGWYEKGSVSLSSLELEAIVAAPSAEREVALLVQLADLLEWIGRDVLGFGGHLFLFRWKRRSDQQCYRVDGDHYRGLHQHFRFGSLVQNFYQLH
jgi:hypothetical protein